MQRTIALVVTLTALVAPHAAAADLDIDPLPGMPNTPGAPVRAASQLTNQFLGQGVLLSSNGGFVAVAKGIGVHWFQSNEFQNGLGGTNAAGQLSYVSPVIFTFVDPASPTTAWATTSFSLYTDYIGIGAQCSLIAYDIDGAIVDSDIKAEHSGVAATGTQYSVSGVGIAKVVFQGAGTQAVSNIVFADPAPACNVECAGDLTGDGLVDGADLGSILAAWGTSGGCPSADFDGDGTVDGADLSVVLAAWGACP
ncbi:MAG: hypothetical protein JNM94_07720 [Phycisphaerae bacterium]|nr:hypothetical protein [Phycisphaerae bacterium]